MANSSGDDEPSVNPWRKAAAHIERCLRDGSVIEAQHALSGELAAAGRAQAVSINAGLAWLYDSAGEIDKAIAYAQAALLIDPQDDLAYEVLPWHEAHLVAHNLLRHRKKGRARRILQRLCLESKAAEELLALMDYVDTETRRIAAMPKSTNCDRAPLLVNAIVWGEPYIDALFTYGGPSLLAAGNLPALARERDIIFDFYTAETDRARIDGHPIAAQMKRYATFRYNVIPAPILNAKADDASRWCAAAAQQCSALRARHLGADLLFLCGSAIYSASCLSRAYDFIDEGYKAVVCMAPRTQESAPYAALSAYASIADGEIAVEASDLADFVVRNLHSHALDCFIDNRDRTVAQNPVALFFKDRTGFSCRTYEPNPLIISHELLRKEFEIDYFTIDVRFISELLGECDYGSILKVVRRPEDGIVVTDVDCADGPGIRDYGGVALTVENCANGALFSAARGVDLDYFRWALSQRFSFGGSSDGALLPSDGLDETETTARILALIDENGPGVFSRVAVYESLVEPS